MIDYYIQGKLKMTTKKSRCTSILYYIKIFVLFALVLTSSFFTFLPISDDFSPYFQENLDSANSVIVDRLEGNSVDLLNHPRSNVSQEPIQDSQLLQSVTDGGFEIWEIGESVTVDQTFSQYPLSYASFNPRLDDLTILVGTPGSDIPSLSAITAYESQGLAASDHNPYPNAPYAYYSTPEQFLWDNTEGAGWITNSFSAKFSDTIGISAGYYYESYVYFTIKDVEAIYSIEFHGGAYVSYDSGYDEFPTSSTDAEAIGLTTNDMVFGGDISVRLRIKTNLVDSGGVTVDYATTTLYIDYFDYLSGAWSVIAASTSYSLYAGDSDEHIDLFRPLYEYLKITPYSITHNPRSEYKNVGVDTYSHRISVDCLEYGNILTIYKPSNWNFSHSEPYVSFTEISDVVLTDTVKTRYDLFFTSVSPKQYLAISELETYDFEGSFDSWFEHTSFTFDDITLNSTIVSSGAFSTRLDTDIDADYWVYDGVSFGGKYFSFDYYVESGISTFSVQYYTGSSTELTTYTSIEPNRWHKGFIYIHPKASFSSPTHQIRFYFPASQAGIIFIDNGALWGVNHESYTSAYQELTIEFYPKSIDGYSNPYLTNFDYNCALYDRTASTKIVENNNLKSDVNGKVSWVVDTSQYSAFQDSREIEVRSWSYDSWFSTGFTDDRMESTDDWSGNANNTLSVETSNTKKDNALKVTKSEDTPEYLNPQYSESGTWDFTHVDYYRFWVYYATGAGVVDAFTFYCYNSWGNGFARTEDLTGLANETWLHVTIDKNDFSLLGSSDITTIDFMYFRLSLECNTSNYAIYDELQLITTQKSYFTPMYPTDWDFAQSDSDLTWGSDGWDFQEEAGSNDGSDDWNGIAAYFYTEGAENGYWWGKGLSAANYAYISFEGESYTSIDSDIYNTFSFRFWSNISFELTGGNGEFQLRDSHWGDWIGGYDLAVVAETWNIIEIDLSEAINWDGVENDFQLFFYEINDEFDAGFEFRIDWIRLFHRDTPSLSVADSYAYLSSSNNSFEYHVEHDNQVLGYYTDLQTIVLNQSIGAHSVNATVFNDNKRENLVFLSGESVIESYEITIEFMVYIESFSLSESLVNIFITSTRSGAYYIYENDTEVGNGNFISSGTSIAHTKNTQAGYLINLAYKFVNDTDIWFNTSYSNPGISNFFVYIESFSVSSAYVDIFITSTRSGAYTIYENDIDVGNGNFISSGTSISHTRSNQAGLLVNLAYKFVNSTDIWFNTSYSNIEFYVQTSSFADSEEAWQLWVRPTYDCNYIIYENGSNIGSGIATSSGSTLSRIKATEPGLYWINISFTYQSQTIWTNNSYYISPASAYPQIYSTPGNQTIEWGNIYQLVWLLDKLHQWELYQNGSVITSDQTSSPRYLIPASLAIGVYNFTVIIENQYENQNSSTVFITVADTIAPSYQVNYYNNSIFEDQEVDTSILFALLENVSVLAYRNSTLVYNDTINTNFTVSLSTLGVWNITIILTDNHSNSLTESLFYEIMDIILPVFYEYDSEKTITMGSTIDLVTSVTELNPDQYRIEYASQIVASGGYSTKITYSQQFIYQGTYHFFIYANDTSGNENYLHITVSVTKPQTGQYQPIDYTDTAITDYQEEAKGFEFPILLLTLMGAVFVGKKRRK